VIEKTERGTQKIIMLGQLSTELLQRQNAASAKRQKWKDTKGKVVQKYSKIYSSVARRQIKDNDDNKARVVNIRERSCERPRERSGARF
jgi:hypothetical protein